METVSRGHIKGIHKVKHSRGGGPHPEQTGPHPGSQPGLLDLGEGERERKQEKERRGGGEERRKGKRRNALAFMRSPVRRG